MNDDVNIPSLLMSVQKTRTEKGRGLLVSLVTESENHVCAHTAIGAEDARRRAVSGIPARTTVRTPCRLHSRASCAPSRPVGEGLHVGGRPLGAV